MGPAWDFETSSTELGGCFGFVKTCKINRVLRKIFSLLLRSLQDSREIRGVAELSLENKGRKTRRNL